MLEPYALRRFYDTKMDLDEEIYAWTRGMLVVPDEEPVPGVLVATHRRVCFYGISRLRRGATFEDIAMQSLVGVSGEEGSGRIRLDGAAGRSIEFVARRRTDTSELIAAVRQAHEEFQHASAEAAAAPLLGVAPSSPAEAEAASASAPDAIAVAQEERSAARLKNGAAVGATNGSFGAHAAEQGASADQDPTQKPLVEFANVTYIRGVPGQFDATRGVIWVDREAVRFGDEGVATISIDLASITSVEVIPDTRFLPSGERNKGISRSIANAAPAPTPAPSTLVQSVTRRTEVTTWYLSIGYLTGAGTFEALFSVSSWNSPRQKANDIRFLILTRREELTQSGATTLESDASPSYLRTRLVELRQLFESELISAEEYETKRREILGRI